MSTTKGQPHKRRFVEPSERLTLFSMCCPCLLTKKLKCKASDIALVMYDKDEPHEYVLEKLSIKRLPLRIFGVKEDFEEYEEEMKQASKFSNEKVVTTTEYDKEEKSTEWEEELYQNKAPAPTASMKKPYHARLPAGVSSVNSLKTNCHTPVDELLVSNLSLGCEPLTGPKSGDELVLKTITADVDNELVTEVDQRIAKMSPDVEKTINTLKAVKPRPVSARGIPFPIKNQKKRLSMRNIENEGMLTKSAYSYEPCTINDNPLQGIHYTLNKTTFTPAIEEKSKSIIADYGSEVVMDDRAIGTRTSSMKDQGTTNYEDADTLAAAEEETSTLPPAIFDDNMPSTSKNITFHRNEPRRGVSMDSMLSPSPDSSGSERRKSKEFGFKDFSVYNAEMIPARRRKPTCPKKKNSLKWKIVIDNPEDTSGSPPSTRTSDFRLSGTEHCSRKRSSCRSRVSY